VYYVDQYPVICYWAWVSASLFFLRCPLESYEAATHIPVLCWVLALQIKRFANAVPFVRETDLILLLILFLFLFLLRRPLQKSPRLRRFKLDLYYEIWQLCSSRKYVSIDGVGFSIWRHTFKMSAMTSFHATKCCHLVSEHKASAGAYAAVAVSSWIYSTFVLVILTSTFFSRSYLCTAIRSMIMWLDLAVGIMMSPICLSVCLYIYS